MNKLKTIFISADHGLAIIYFLQSEVVKTLTENGIQVVVLTDEGLIDQIAERFHQPGLMVEGLELDKCQSYTASYKPTLQYWSNFLRRVGTSNKINTEAMDSHVNQVMFEASGRQRIILPLIKALIWVLRNSETARKYLIHWQMRFTPEYMMTCSININLILSSHLLTVGGTIDIYCANPLSGELKPGR